MLILMGNQSENTLTLYPYGDTELHFASGDNWSLPLYVQWRIDKENNRHYGLLIPPLGFYHSQMLALKALLQAHDIMGRKDRWLIPRQMVEVLLHKAAGITPVAYYKWPEPDMPAIPLPKVLKVDKLSGVAVIDNAPDGSGQDPFVTFIAQRTEINRSIVKVVFRAICDHAPAWMLEQRRPVDFGFCKLFAAPFRPNWKEIVAFKFKKWKLLELFRAPQEHRLDMLDSAGLPSALCSMHNIAIKKSGHKQRIVYTLEAVPTARFEKEVDAVERKRIACGGTSYVASFEKTVEALYENLLAALEGYLHKTGLPFARIYESSQGGQLRLLPTTSQSIQVRGVGIRDIPTHIVAIDSPFSLLAERSDELLVQAQAPGVPQMPDLSERDADLRECKGKPDVDHEDGQDRTSGVLLLASGKKSNGER